MANHFAPQWAMGWELLLVLGIGAAVIVALAAAAGRSTASPARQAAIWRIATLGMFVLLLFELTGLGQAVAELSRQRLICRRAIPPANQPADAGSPLPTVGPAATDDAGQTGSATFAATGLAGDAVSTGPRDLGETPVEAVDKVTLAGAQTRQARAPCTHGRPNVHAAAVADASPAVPGRSWWLAVVWAVGTVAVLAGLLGGRVAAWFFRRHCASCDDETILAQVATLRSTFGIRRGVAVLTSPRIAAPLVLGGWRPALVLPPRFTRDFDVRQQDTILAHEMAHLVSRDSAWQAAALVLCGLLWWHPLVWWSRRQLRAANEALADEASLVVPDGPRILAEALVLLGQRLVRLPPRFGLSLGGGRFRSGLGRRVQRLLSLPHGSWRAPRRARLAFAHFTLPVLMALAAIVGTAWAPSQVPLMQGETTMSVLSNSWRCSLVATALWTMLGGAPAPAAADGQPSGTPATSADREKIEQQLRSIHQKAEQLEKDGKHDEAEKLKHQAYELYAKLRGGSTSSQPAVSGPEADKIRARVKEMSQKADQLEKDGKHDEAEKLKHEARELYMKLRGGSTSSQPAVSGPEADKIRARIKEIGQQVGQLEKDGKHDEVQRLKIEAMALYNKLNPRANAVAAPAGPEREALRQQWLAIQDKLQKAMQAGKPEDVQRLKQQAEALRAKLYPQMAYVPGRPQPGGDREAKLQHLRAAAENLKAAGFEPEAQHVMQMIARLQAEGSGESRPRSESTRPSPGAGGTLPPGVSTANPGPYAAAPAVQELRSQVEQMRRELREMREQLNRAKSSEHN